MRLDRHNHDSSYQKTDRTAHRKRAAEEPEFRSQAKEQDQAHSPPNLGKGVYRGKGSSQNWWSHLRTGLVRDPSGTHYKLIGKAIWLYLYFLVAANWKHGTLFRRLDTISVETSFSPRSIKRWLQILRKMGYITTRKNGRSFDISITKWRPVSRKIDPHPDNKV